MQPSGVNLTILGQQTCRDQQQEQRYPKVHSHEKCFHNSFRVRTVYHRIFLTQIEIFRLIRIHYVCSSSCREVLRVTLNRAAVNFMEEGS